MVKKITISVVIVLSLNLFVAHDSFAASVPIFKRYKLTKSFNLFRGSNQQLQSKRMSFFSAFSSIW